MNNRSSAPQAGEWLPLFLLSLYAGCYFFALILNHYLGGYWDVKVDYPIYISSWALIPAACLCTAWGLHRLKQAFYADNAAFYPALLAVNTAVWAFQWAAMPAVITPRYLQGIITGTAMVNLAALGLAALPSVAVLNFWPRVGSWAAGLSPMVALIGLKHFDAEAFPAMGSWPLMLGATLLGIALLGLKPLPVESERGRAWGLLFLGLVGLLMYSVKMPELVGMLIHHHNFYLGAVNDVLHGKTMLVDVNCQYGVGVVYFIALFFKTGLLKLYYPQFMYLIMLLWIAEYGFLYWLLGRLLKSRWLVMLAMASALLFERYGYYSSDNRAFPSVGPLRFGLPLLVLGGAYMRKAGAEKGGLLKNLDLVLIGLASLWSFETFVYSLAGYLAMLLYSAWAESEGYGSFVKKAGGEFLRLFAALAAAHVGFALLTRLLGGAWPEWNSYLDYLRLYGVTRFGSIEFPIFSPWIFLPALSLASLLAACFALFLKEGKAAKGDAGAMLAFGLTVTGIAQFSYFIGRSHPNNLSHCCLVTLIAAFYWLDRAWASPLLSKSFKFACAFSATMILCSFAFAFQDNLAVCFRQTLLSGVSWAEFQKYAQDLRNNGPDTEQERQIGALVDKYLPPQAKVALFVRPRINTETMLYMKRSHFLPISNPIEDSLVAANINRAMKAASEMHEGDLIFIADDEADWGVGLTGFNIAESALVQIRSLFKLQLLEHASCGLKVFRLMAPDKR